MTGPRKANRGPNAAQANRRALVAAALEVFAEGGIDAPLSAVAKRAGVGQGSLYRHFPDRISLALAAFEDNVTELEVIAADPTCVLDDLLKAITDQAVNSVVFIDIVTTAAADPRLEVVVERVKATLTGTLREAHRTGAVRESVTVDDVMLAVGMVAALVGKMPPADRALTAERAWAVLRRAILP
ncbi:TetR family transcriptional regulator [Micromonospora sp. CA-263727]|uniref:TetR family transcriptional regulator n=1 Tax=Micromonospora sp. CA-263727 TaxID=3239967 RepID=UPI003D932F9B